MGIRINPRSWRAPLVLIDSWLPASTQDASRPRDIAQPAKSSLIRRWFGRPSPLTKPGIEISHPVQPRTGRSAGSVRVVHAIDTGQRACRGPRLVISGRISDVCAELDRLAALESRSIARCN